MENKPYVKQFDVNGKLLNPITKSNPYFSVFDNRKKRHTKEKRFNNNRNSYPLTVFKTDKFVRQIQHIFLKDGSIKSILHYLPC